MNAVGSVPVSEPTCIVVIGMHRSGTSLVSGLLYRLGVNMGTAFRKPDRHNATGYYEDIDFRDLNKMIINRAGGRWFNPPNPEDVSAAVKHYSDKVDALIESKDGLWGFKDPRTVFTIHALEHHLPEDTRFIRVSRNTLETVASLSRRASLKEYKRTDAHWYLIVRRYSDAIQGYLQRTAQPVFSIEYERLLYRDTARDIVQRLAHFCDLDWRDDTLIANAMNLIAFRDNDV